MLLSYQLTQISRFGGALNYLDVLAWLEEKTSERLLSIASAVMAFDLYCAHFVGRAAHEISLEKFASLISFKIAYVALISYITYWVGSWFLQRIIQLSYQIAKKIFFATCGLSKSIRKTLDIPYEAQLTDLDIKAYFRYINDAEMIEKLAIFEKLEKKTIHERSIYLLSLFISIIHFYYFYERQSSLEYVAVMAGDEKGIIIMIFYIILIGYLWALNFGFYALRDLSRWFVFSSTLNHHSKIVRWKAETRL